MGNQFNAFIKRVNASILAGAGLIAITPLLKRGQVKSPNKLILTVLFLLLSLSFPNRFNHSCRPRLITKGGGDDAEVLPPFGCDSSVFLIGASWLSSRN